MAYRNLLNAFKQPMLRNEPGGCASAPRNWCRVSSAQYRRNVTGSQTHQTRQTLPMTTGNVFWLYNVMRMLATERGSQSRLEDVSGLAPTVGHGACPFLVIRPLDRGLRAWNLPCGPDPTSPHIDLLPSDLQCFRARSFPPGFIGVARLALVSHVLRLHLSCGIVRH